MSDRCPICDSPKRVLGSKFVSEVGSTDVYSVIQMGCLNDSYPGNENKPCVMYAGVENPDPSLIEENRKKVG